MVTILGGARRTGNWLRWACGIGLVLLICPHVAWAEYVSPNWEGISYDAERTILSPAERFQLADALAECARSIPGVNAAADSLRAKSIALALRLDADNKSAVILNGKFKHGRSDAEGASTSVPKEALLKMFEMQVKRLRESTSGSDATFAAYFLDWLVAMEPANEEMLYQSELAQRKTPINWAVVLSGQANRTVVTPTPMPMPGQPGMPSSRYPQGGRIAGPPTSSVSAPVPTSATPATPIVLKKTQAKVNGLAVMSSGESMIYGKVLEIIVTASPSGDNGESEGKFITETTADTKISKDEALRLMKLRSPSGRSGIKFDISFDDKYVTKSGGSAGTALTLAMLSIVDGFDIDPLFAVTGDITVDGKVRKIGGIPLKIHGAKDAGCKIVAIPADNEGEIVDLMVLQNHQALAEIQIFSIATIDEAIQLAHQDRGGNLGQAISLFGAIQQDMGNGVTLSNPGIRDRLDEVLRLAPNHLSAKYLKMKSQGAAPTVLSARAAVSEILRILSPMIGSGDEKGPKGKAFLPTPVYTEMRRQLGSIEAKVPEAVQNIYHLSMDLIDRIQNFKEEFVPSSDRSMLSNVGAGSNEVPKQRRAAEIIKEFKDLQAEFEKLGYSKEWNESQSR